MFRLLILCSVLSFVKLTAAASLPQYFFQTKVADGLNSPVSFTIAADGRIFICEQAGRIRIVKDGVLLATPFLDLPCGSGGDRGMLSIAFDRNFATNRFVYVLHTSTTMPAYNIVSRFTVSGDTVVAGSQVVLLQLSNFESGTHNNSGCLATGPDGKLYIGTGDAGLDANAQNLANTHGKVLRINTDGSIPSDNPYFNTTTGNMRAIWATGVRLAFTMNFDPQSGNLFINDVGGSLREEINEGNAGANFGWPSAEGNSTNVSFKNPVHAYGHGTGTGLGCAITGGTFYNPATPLFPAAYRGHYFFMDYCGSWIRQFVPANPNSVSDFATGIDGTPVGLQVSPAGELYYISRTTNALMKISYTPSDPPLIIDEPQDVQVFAGDEAVFSVNCTGSGTLSYQWQKNGSDIPNARSAELRISNAALSDSGSKYSCRITNQFGVAQSRQAVLTVVQNQAPVIVISPVDSSYVAGQAVPFSATAVDPEDGELPATNFAWKIHRLVNGGEPVQVAEISGVASGTFIPPAFGIFDPRSTYMISMSVPDSRGLVGTKSVLLNAIPRTVALDSVPVGVPITIDGAERTTPYELATAEGFTHTIQAPKQFGSEPYEFQNWSGNKSVTLNLLVAGDVSFTAFYAVKQAPKIVVLTSATSLTVGSHILFGLQPAMDAATQVEWKFGDGTIINGASTATHAYSATGEYLITATFTSSGESVVTAGLSVTINDGTVLADSDGDGVADNVEVADGTNPFDASSVNIRALTVSQFSALLDSTKPLNDRCSVKASIAEALAIKNAEVKFKIAGFSQQFNTGSSARGKLEAGKFSLQSNSKKKASIVQIGLAKSALASILPEPVNQPDVLISIPLSFQISGKLYGASVTVHCRSKNGKCAIKSVR